MTADIVVEMSKENLLPGGVIGNTQEFGSCFPGSSPGWAATFIRSTERMKVPCAKEPIGRRRRRAIKKHEEYTDNYFSRW